MRRRRILIAALGIAASLLLLAALALYLLLPRIAGEAIERELIQAGLENVVVKTEKIAAGSARFAEIGFRQESAPGRLSASFRGIQLEFALASLLRGEVALVRVESASVAWEKYSPAKAEPASRLPEFPSLKLPRIPLPRVEIEKLELAAPGLIPGNKTELENVEFRPGLSAFTLGFAWKPALFPKILWTAKPPLMLGTLKIRALEQSPPEKLAVKLALESAGGQISRIALSSPLGIRITATGDKSAEVVSLVLSDFAADWSKRGLGAKFALKESRGKFAMRIEANGPGERGEIRAKLALEKITFAAGTNPLSSFLAVWPFAFDLEGGSLEGEASGSFQPANGDYDYKGGVRARGLAGKQGVIAMADALATCAFQGTKRATPRLKCDEIRVASLEAGVPVREIALGLSADFGKKQPVLTIPRFSAKTLGGTLRAENAVLRIGGANKAVSISVEGVDLQEILRAKKHAEFTATGTLDGNIPLRLAPEGIYVEAGEIHARGPGVLQYRPAGADALAASNPALGIAVGALSDFQYHELRAGLNYTPAGLLKMAVALKGKNPSFQQGQTVHFNINLEENILTLIQSLTVAEGIGKQIDDRVQDSKQR